MTDHRFRYGAWQGGPDPLAPPYDVRRVLDEVGQDVLAGGSLRDALRDLMRRGFDGHRGLDELRDRARRMRRAAQRRGDLSGTLDQVRAALDQALAAERETLAGMEGDDARLAEMDLATLPDDTAGAVRALDSYDWRSDEARATFEAIKQLLQREVLDAQFAGMKRMLEDGDPEAMQAVKDMLADLNELLAAHARGEDTTDRFQRLHGQARRPLPGEAGERRRAHRRPRPPAGRRGPDDGVAASRAARAARAADERGALRPGPRLPDGAALGQPACAATRSRPWARAGHGPRRGARLQRRRRGGRRARRPRGPGEPARRVGLRLAPRRRGRRHPREAPRCRRGCRPARAARAGAGAASARAS